MKTTLTIGIFLIMLTLIFSGCTYDQWFPTTEDKYCEAPVPEEEGVPGEVVVIEEQTPIENETQLPTEETTEPEETPDYGNLPVKQVFEGQLVSFPNLQATDPDGDKLIYTFSEPLNSSGEWQTTVGDAGDYIVSITVSDGDLSSSQDVLIRVISLNKAPVIIVPSTVTVNEGETVVLTPTISDPDGDDVSVAYSGWMTSAEKKTGYNDAGVYQVTISATDGELVTTKEVTVIVENVNRAPVIESLDDITVTEGESVTVAVNTADPDGDPVQVSFSPPLDENGEWDTEVGDAGTYDETVTVSDGDLESTSSFVITVNAANNAPVIEPIAPIVVDEGDTVTLSPEVVDPDGDDVTITYSGWMTSAEYTTNYDDAGDHIVTITASDGKAETSIDVTVTVNNMNRPPVLDLGL